MKVCQRCNTSKLIGDYRPSQYKKIYGGWCRLCCKEYEDAHKERKSSYNREYSKAHKDTISQNKKDNKARSNLKQKERRDKNREIYNVRYLPRIMEYRKNRRKNDPQFRLREMLSSRIHQALKSKKYNSISNFLPYTIKALKTHIENQFEQWMTWSNWGVYNKLNWNDNNPSTWTWNIDHIIPHSFLPYTSMSDENFKKCWALENLRPLSAKQNVTENNKRII